jgi:molybdate transport system substrate-binding protein
MERTIRQVVVRSAALAAAFLLAHDIAHATDVKLLSSTAARPVIMALGPQFERLSSNRLIVRFELTPEVPKLITDGEIIDVAIADPNHIDALIKSGKVTSSSRVELVRFGFGVGVRSNTSMPNVASIDGFRQALLNANSVAYIGAGASGRYFIGALERLGITEEMKGKLKPGSAAENISAVAKGEVDIVVMPVPLIIAGAGVKFADALPAEYQDYTVLVAGLATAAPQAAAGQALIKYLLSSEADTVLKEKGYERIIK